MKNKDVEVYFVNVEKGHDMFFISKKITHIYYVLDGEGFFTIEGRRYDVKPDMVVEVPTASSISHETNIRIVLYDVNCKLIRCYVPSN